LRGFLFERGFEMGKVDQTLFLLRHGRDNLIVQVYMDNIVFGGSSNSLVARFAEDMSREFEMSMMGELQFFLRLQIKQLKEGTFVHQPKYTKDIVRKFKMEDSKAMMTPMSMTTALDADEEGEHVDQKEYRSMIRSLLYLTATRPDIQFSVCLRARFQASPRTSHQQFLLPIGSFLFFFSFISFFHGLYFFCRGLVSFFSRKAAWCERCSPWKKRKYLGVHVRRIRSCSFWIFFTVFFLSKRNSRQETGRGARENRTARDQE
jgi:hypothetical protein